MSEIKLFNHDNLLRLFAILSGLLVGTLITVVCIYFNWEIYGVDVDIFIAPIIAGFVETFVSTRLRNKSSGAISALILFFVTNGIGWLFPSQPITFNIFTIGGIILMLQAAFPLLVNYLIISILLLFSYLLGLVGSFFASKFDKNSTHITFTDIEDQESFTIPIFNSKPDIPIKEYHGLVCAEDVIEFEEKDRERRLEYMGSTVENKNLIKLKDYSNSREYILHLLEEEALKVNANAIIDIEFEYTNYNQQVPPDIVVAAYGTAVTLDEKYI